MLYAIKILKTGRYVMWCDRNWYGTTDSPMPRFPKEEAHKIADMIQDHYVYDMDIIASDGTSENVCHIASLRREKAIKQVLKQQSERKAPMRATLFNLSTLHR